MGTGIETITIIMFDQNDMKIDLQFNNVKYAFNMSSNLFSLATR